MENNAGYLDNILAIFSRHGHPFILLGDLAMGWMGCRNIPDDSIDVLIRSSYHDSILKDLLALGDWEITQCRQFGAAEDLAEGETLVTECLAGEGETLLKNVGVSIPWPYMRLFPEELFFLSIDGPVIEVPELWPWNTTLVEIKYHPDPKNFLYGPKHYTAFCPESLPPLTQRSRSSECKVPIYIPTIPTFINALWDQIREYKGAKDEMLVSAGCNISNFIRYLFLDRPHQKELILSEMYSENREVMKDRINRFKRMVNVSINPRTGEIGPINPWEAAYPNGQEF